jgi:hypothetical protein
MSTSVICFTKSDTQAAEIIDHLRSSGFSASDISVLFPDKSGTRDFAHEHHTKAPEGAATGAGLGGIAGGALGWLIGVGSLAIPGLGAFIAAGPLMAALSGAAAGAALGGLTGALAGLGFSEIEAKRYEGKLREGNVLVAVHCEDGDEVDRAKNILRSNGAEDITSTSEASVPA